MSIIAKIKSSELFRVTSLNGIWTLVKIATGLVTSKVLAIYLGPPGMALIGNFRNFLSSVDSVTSLGFQNGIVKYIAENDEDKPKLKSIISTLFITVLVVSIICGFGLFFFADYWNQIIFGDKFQFQIIFKTLAIILPLYIGSNYLLAIINGFSLFKKVIYINIVSSILGLMLTIYLVYNYGTLGALLSIISVPILLFFFGFYYTNEKISLRGKYLFNNFDFSILKNLSHYFLMIIISGILGQVVMIAIRNNLIHTLDLKQAGFWEAMTRISSNYMLFVNTLLTIYYYPKLVIAQNNEESKKVIWDFYKNVMPFFGLGLIVIYFLRFFVVKTLFTPDFEPVSQLFLWQLVGDFIKTISWILGLQFFAKKMTKAFIITDVLSLVLLYFSSIYCISVFKTEGLVIAHAFTYFMYLIVLGFYFRKSLF